MYVCVRERERQRERETERQREIEREREGETETEWQRKLVRKYVCVFVCVCVCVCVSRLSRLILCETLSNGSDLLQTSNILRYMYLVGLDYLWFKVRNMRPTVRINTLLAHLR